MVSTDANVPDWPHIRLNINQDNSAEPANNLGVTYGSQAISASGSQSISSITGLTASTAYYMYAAQIDANGNPSATASSSFTTSAPPAPTLSVPVAATNKTIGVTTNANTGTMYWVVTTSSTAPTAAQIKAGQNNAGGAAVASGNKAIAVAAKWATAVSGLTNGTTYYGYFVHNNSSGDSNVAATGSFVPAASTSQWSAANSNAAWAISGGSSNVGTHSGGAWNTLRDNNANTLGVIVHTITTLSTDLRLGLSLASVGTAGSGNEAATVSWDAYSGQFYVAGTLIGTYQAYAAGDGSTVTIIFNNGYVYFYLGSTLVTSYDVSALGTSLYPTAFSNASSVVTTTFTNW
jgi:hypothetical protein